MSESPLLHVLVAPDKLCRWRAFTRLCLTLVACHLRMPINNSRSPHTALTVLDLIYARTPRTAIARSLSGFYFFNESCKVLLDLNCQGRRPFNYCRVAPCLHACLLACRACDRPSPSNFEDVEHVLVRLRFHAHFENVRSTEWHYTAYGICRLGSEGMFLEFRQKPRLHLQKSISTSEMLNSSHYSVLWDIFNFNSRSTLYKVKAGD